jgi:hypothetical protein
MVTLLDPAVARKPLKGIYLKQLKPSVLISPWQNKRTLILLVENVFFCIQSLYAKQRDLRTLLSD